MFNINNKNLIFFGIGLLAIFSFIVLITPKTSLAVDVCSDPNYNGWYRPTCGNYYTSNNFGYNNTNNNYGNNNYANNTVNPVPSISSLNPNSANINSNMTVTVLGYGFVPGSIVKWDGADRYTTFIDSSTLRAQLYSSDLNNKGNYLITVLNPVPGGGLSNAVLFTVNSNVVANTVTKTSNNTINKTSTSTSNSTTNTKTDKGTAAVNQASDQAAGALFGSNAFLPSSLLQWFFFIILILLAVLLWRKLYVSDEEKHHSTLKHA